MNKLLSIILTSLRGGTTKQSLTNKIATAISWLRNDVCTQAGFIRLTKKTLVLLLAVLILLPSFSYLLLFKLPKPAKAEWYDDNWGYI